MPSEVPLHPKIAEIVTRLTTFTASTSELINLIGQREMKIAEAIMELQKADCDKARVLRLLS